MAGGAEHLADLAEEPAEVVQLVDGVEEDTAALRGPHGVVLAIVPSRPPVGQIRPELGPHRQDLADPLVIEQRLHAPEAGEKAQVEADGEEPAASLRLVDQLLHLVTHVGDGLLDEEMGAGGESPASQRHMRRGRRADQRPVRWCRERLVEAPGRRDARDGADLHDAAGIVVPREDGVAEGDEVPAVALADGARADDEE